MDPVGTLRVWRGAKKIQLELSGKGEKLTRYTVVRALWVGENELIRSRMGSQEGWGILNPLRGQSHLLFAQNLLDFGFKKSWQYGSKEDDIHI